MVIKKVRRIYRIDKIESRPVVIRIRKKDGSFVELKGRKITRKPQKIVFRRIAKEYVKPKKVEGEKDE